MNLTRRIMRRIRLYDTKGNLDHTAQLFLTLSEVYHNSTKEHSERVALMAEATALALRKDKKAAFFAGLLHDFGKILLPSELFDGHNITQEEYDRVKQHARAGFNALRKLHQFTSLCAGFHHNLYTAGYGTTVEDFPSNWSPATVKKVLEISTIISICDFVDAFLHRTTQIKDGSNTSPYLKEMLYKKYPNDLMVVDTVLAQTKRVLKRTCKTCGRTDIDSDACMDCLENECNRWVDPNAFKKSCGTTIK